MSTKTPWTDELLDEMRDAAAHFSRQLLEGSVGSRAATTARRSTFPGRSP